MKKKGVLAAAFVTLFIVITTALLGYFDVLGRWDRSVTDLLNQRGGSVKRNIYIIGIDDKALEKYGRISKWSRELSGKLVEKLNADDNARPAVIGFDVIYSEDADEAGDQYFADACRKAGNVVAAETFVFREQPETDADGKTTYNPFYVDYRIMPYESLRKSVDTGFANTVVGQGGYVRQAILGVDYNGQTEYSFAAEIYRRYQEMNGKEVVMPETFGRGNQFYFTYSGKPGAYMEISMADIMDGSVDTRLFKDAIVLVGPYAVGMQDSFHPAIAHDGEMFGVEVHANIIQSLMEGKTQLPFPQAVYAIVTGLICGAFYLLARRGRIICSTIVVAGVFITNIVLVMLFYRNGFVLPVLLLPTVLLIIYAEQLIQGYLAEYMRRRRVLSVFKQYMAPQIVDKISRDKDFELVLGGENRHIAVLFVDIRGFTTMSESLEPEQVVEILNEYLALTTKSVFDNEGTLDKFVGDATMAVFNAPFDLEDYIFKAVCAAWDMKLGADAVAKKFEERFGKSVAFGIGVNCGNAVVGNIGCDFRMDYTAIGDTVNTAARLESNAKPGQILISQGVYDAVHERIDAVPIGEIPLKGKSQGVYVYQVDAVRKEIN